MTVMISVDFTKLGPVGVLLEKFSTPFFFLKRRRVLADLLIYIARVKLGTYIYFNFQ